MKNFLLYITPRKNWWDKYERNLAQLVKIQIDNSIDLGWKREDIILVTNFDYEYNGVKARIIDDSHYCEHWNKSSKVSVIISLLKDGTVKPGELWWFHDFDAFQVHPITEEEINNQMGYAVVGFTDYGWFKKWNTGSIFFKKNSVKVFEWLRNELYKLQTDEERALVSLTNKNYQNIDGYIKRLNVTYNFPGCLSGERHLNITVPMATKPIKVLHFHPEYKYWGKYINFLHVMCGQNRLNLDLVGNRLLKHFKKHLPKLCPKK
uniref:Glycosyltransferase n=1 Tax=viral metagenome TaxID=1070528 RepID=A0A6M3IR61_9ZZZZ